MKKELARTGVLGLMAAAVIGTVLAAPSTAAIPSDGAVVATDKGPVRGTVTAGYRAFDGIPYAAPPVGRLRWVAPQPVEGWTGVRDATEPGDRCAQGAGFPDEEASDAEDCLYLNVTTPRRTGTGHLPVMVWIHGGGFFSGSGGEYDPKRLAVAGKVIVVTLNYRLGALGFLAHPALDHGTDQPSGDYGLQDQQAALRWVSRNAGAFGGDPHRVTIFGESAGGISVCSHLSAPGSAGLFQRAIIQSGPCSVNWPYAPSWAPVARTTAQAYGQSIAKRLGCGDPAHAAACLRRVPARDLAVLAPDTAEFSPVYGNSVLPVAPSRAVATGRFARVPVMVGTTSDEYRTFQAGVEEQTGELTPAGYPEQVTATFGRTQAARVLAHYPLSRYSSASVAWSSIVTDWGLTCPALNVDESASRQVPTYAFEFSDPHAPWFKGMDAPRWPTGAYHAAELQYLFDWTQATGILSAGQQRLSDTMIGAWARFAATGSPGWQPFNNTGQARSFAPGAGGIHPVDLGHEHQCGFWRTVTGR